MPVFRFRALQPDGRITEGQLEAAGRAEALRQVDARHGRPIQLVEHSTLTPVASPTRPAPNGAPSRAPSPTPASTAPTPSPLSSLSFRPGQRVSARQLEDFTRLLSSLLAAGVPLSRALVILHKEATTPAARDQWRDIHDRVVDGMPLADAMARSPRTFPRVYVAMVEAGEMGGFLDVVLAQIADFQAREKELRGNVLTALLYPLILLVLALSVLVFLLVFFIPRFQTIFAGFGGQLPWLTQMIVGVSDWLRAYGLIAAILAIAASIGARTWWVSPAGKRTWEGIILRLIVVGPLVARFAMARFCRMLGTLLSAGVPLVQGLNVARRSLGNQILVDAVSTAIERVKEGKALGPSLSECRRLFPGSAVEMIAVAEESGRLDRELVRLAEVTEGDLDRHLRTAVALAEPLMLFAIAAFIGVIFIGMVIPIFTLQDYIQ